MLVTSLIWAIVKFEFFNKIIAISVVTASTLGNTSHIPVKPKSDDRISTIGIIAIKHLINEIINATLEFSIEFKNEIITKIIYS